MENFNLKNDLRLFALFYVDEHENFTKKECSVLYKFIKEATLDEVANLLATGNMEKNISESARTAAWSAVAKTHLGTDPIKRVYQAGQGTGISQGLAAAAVIALASTLAFKAYQRFLSKAAKACKGKSGDEKTNCMNKFKQQAQKAKIDSLQKSLQSCSKSKDPSACKIKMTKKINKEKAKLGTL